MPANPSTWEVEVGGSWSQGHFGCFKQINKQTKFPVSLLILLWTHGLWHYRLTAGLAHVIGSLIELVCLWCDVFYSGVLFLKDKVSYSPVWSQTPAPLISPPIFWLSGLCHHPDLSNGDYTFWTSCIFSSGKLFHYKNYSLSPVFLGILLTFRCNVFRG